MAKELATIVVKLMAPEGRHDKQEALVCQP